MRSLVYFPCFLKKNLLKSPSSNSTSSLLSPGPLAQWPQIEGNTYGFPQPFQTLILRTFLSSNAAV